MQVSNVEFERQPIADHANQLAAGIQQNLKRSLEGLGVVRHFLTPVSLQLLMLLALLLCMECMLKLVDCNAHMSHWLV